MTYHVLRTIAGTVMLTDQPTAGRIVASMDDYSAALEAARGLRVDRYRHKVTGEVRELSDLVTGGCANRSNGVFRWVGAADLLDVVSYAIVVEDKDLSLYEPKVRVA